LLTISVCTITNARSNVVMSAETLLITDNVLGTAACVFEMSAMLQSVR